MKNKRNSDTKRARCREEELNREHEKAMESLHAQKKQLEEQYHEKCR